MPLSADPYIHAFTRLKRGGTKYGPAPHKPVLLLSLLQLVEEGKVTDNRFLVDIDLVATFKEYWSLLVDTPHQADFTQPFYYLQNESANGKPYWFLQANPGCQINAHIKSVKTLADTCAYGFFSDDLWILIQDPAQRYMLRQVLLDTYFLLSKTNADHLSRKRDHYLDDETLDLLNEPRTRYKTDADMQTEEEIFVRNGLFKRLVLQLYDHTCSFTGMTLNSLYRHSFVDACHIHPFARSYNERVTNGISLCPNMHRAFDRGLLSIDERYNILVSTHVREDRSHAYALEHLKGKQILLPAKPEHYPSQESLEWHRVEVFNG